MFGKGAHVAALSPDGALALLRVKGASEVLDDNRVGLVYEVAEVATGKRSAQIVVGAGEIVSRRMIR